MRAGQSEPQHGNLLGQSQADVDRKNTGCISCHVSTDEPSMHPTRTVRLACVDCHGGNVAVAAPAGMKKTDTQYAVLRDRAHVLPRYPLDWNYPSAANPKESKFRRARRMRGETQCVGAAHAILWEPTVSVQGGGSAIGGRPRRWR